MSNFTTLKKITSKPRKKVMQLIPHEWEYVYGKELYQPNSGISASNLKFGKGNLLYLKVSDMNDPNNKIFIYKSQLTCSVKNSQINNSIPENSIVFPKRGAAIFTNKVGILKKRSMLDPNLMALIPNLKKIHHKYLYYYIKYYQLSNICENAGIPQLNNKDLNPLPILLPPLNEQHKIISILSNIDNLIIQIEDIINQLNLLKKGLMQRLFTEGIGHTEFKETRLGKIPKEWDFIQLSDLALEFIGGGTPPTDVSEYWDGDIPWITSAILDKMYITEGMKYITQEGLKNSASNLIPKGSLLISTRVGIGKVGITGIDVAINQDLTGILIDLEKVITEFIYWFLLNSQNQLINISQGTTIKGIERDSLRILKIALPSLSEQQKIVKILNNLNNSIINENQIKTILIVIKKGLMQELLTGRKRVKIN